jgi:hypothetical protein
MNNPDLSRFPPHLSEIYPDPDVQRERDERRAEAREHEQWMCDSLERDLGVALDGGESEGEW